MNEVDKQLQTQIDNISQEVKRHGDALHTFMLSRADNDKNQAVVLTRLEGITANILEQTTKTNGKVLKHDGILETMTPKVDEMFKASEKAKEDRRKVSEKWIDYGIKIALVILGIILTRLGIINFQLPF